MNAWSSRTTSINWMGRRPRSCALLSPSGKRSEQRRATFQTSSIGKAADSDLHRYTCLSLDAACRQRALSEAHESAPHASPLNPGIDGTGSARRREPDSCDNNDQGIAIFILQTSVDGDPAKRSPPRGRRTLRVGQSRRPSTGRAFQPEGGSLL